MDKMESNFELIGYSDKKKIKHNLEYRTLYYKKSVISDEVKYFDLMKNILENGKGFKVFRNILFKI